MAKKKRRKLYDISIDEVSWVDKPANKIPFLFWKRDETEPLDKTDTKLDINFNTNGAPDSTSILVNGHALQNIKGFSLYYSPIGESTISLMCDYTVEAKGESNGGFTALRTYRLSKNTKVAEDKTEKVEVAKADIKDLDILKQLLGDVDDVDPEVDASLAKALAEKAEIVNLYLDDCPNDFAQAIRDIVKLATETEFVEVEAVGLENKVSEEKPKEVKAAEIKEPKEPETKSTASTEIDGLVSSMKEAIQSIDTKIKGAVKDALKEQREADAEAAKAAEEELEEDITEEELQILIDDSIQEALQGEE